MNTPDHWRMRLIGRYPRLFRGHSGYPTCGDGWSDILTRMCVRIAAATNGCRPDALRIVEIKQKTGGLRVQCEANGVPDDVMDRVGDAVELAEARASSTCEKCGAEGRIHDDRGFLQTLCGDHAAGDLVEERPHHRGLHLRWRSVDGKLHLVRCRRYDRGSDTFIDVPVPDDIEA